MVICFICWDIIQYDFTYLLLKGSFCVFPVPVLELAISPRKLRFLYWRMAPETKIWIVGTLIATETSFPLGLS